jgi:hypothetical protein
MNERLQVGTRRRCDNCGKPYTVNRENHRFHSPACRAEFHRTGSPLLRLRPVITKEVERLATEIEFRIFKVLDTQTERRYRAQFPARARKFDAITAAEQDDLNTAETA